LAITRWKLGAGPDERGAWRADRWREYGRPMDNEQNEQVIYEGRPSWRSILGFYIAGLAIVAVAAAIAYAVSGAGLAAAVGGGVFVLLVIVGWLKRVSTRYSITDRRMRIQRGIVRRHVEETRVERVQNVTVSQGVLERILQIGTVDFDTASNREDDTFQFRGIAQPEKITRLVDQAHEANEARQRQQGQPAL
jgi:uncharacterized membrane protein YdbT with pleckstrin-like domain